MKANFKTFDDLVIQASTYLRAKLGKSEVTIGNHISAWKRVEKYMHFNGIEKFDSFVGKDYIEKKLGERDNKQLSRKEQMIVHAVKVLCQFHDTGMVMPRRTPTFFYGPIGDLMSEYLSVKVAQRLKPHTVECHRQSLYRFLLFLDDIGLSSIQSLSIGHVVNYIKSMDPSKVGKARVDITTLREFLHHLYSQNKIDKDLASMIPRFNRRKSPALPSSYSPEEVEKLILAIDRTSKPGKRDYAILLLAARLGLRSSDIASLQFSNIDWVQCSIRIYQFKTGRPLEVPLLPEVGNALIDYLKYGRPEYDSPYLFLLCRSPYSRIYPYTVGQMVQSYFRKAGICTDGRKHGSHALRHSLAINMLNKDTALPVISEVLGHEYTSSTEYYLKVDFTSIQKCVLEVPAVELSFYNQKGGLFYEY